MLGLIIYGSRSIASTIHTGTFACPRCCMQRAYRHQELRAYFTLYFIPLIPMWRNGEYVECTSCGGTYGVEVLTLRMEDIRPQAISRDLPPLTLDYDDEEDEKPRQPPALPAPSGKEALIADVRRSMVLFVAALGKATPEIMQEFRTAFKELIFTDVSDQEVYNDYQLAKGANATMSTFVPARLGSQSEDVRRIVMMVAARIAAAEQTINPNAPAALQQFGQALNLNPSLVQTIISSKGR